MPKSSTSHGGAKVTMRTPYIRGMRNAEIVVEAIDFKAFQEPAPPADDRFLVGVHVGVMQPFNLSPDEAQQLGEALIEASKFARLMQTQRK